jgi:hypothetical protein
MIITKIPREENTQADALARVGSATDQEMTVMKRGILVQPQPTIRKTRDLMRIGVEEESEPEWASEVIKYLKKGELPNDKTQSRKVRLQSTRYTMIDGVLYRNGYTHPLLKCLSAPEAHYVSREIHEGVCGNC